MKRKTQIPTIIADLTSENAANVSTIINKAHPEWGSVRFTYKGQPLLNGDFAHTWGSGSNGAVLHLCEMKYWGVVSFK